MPIEPADPAEPLAAALRDFINAPTATVAARVFEENRKLLASPEAKDYFVASLEGNAGETRASLILRARWNLLDRFTREGPDRPLEDYDTVIESVLAVLNVPQGGRAVIDADLSSFARAEVDWVFADLALQPRTDEEIEQIVRRWQQLRSWRGKPEGVLPDPAEPQE